MISRNEFLSQFIWNNKLFTYKSKPLCFTNWIKGGILYVKDIFNKNGELYDISFFTNALKKNNNTLCEYIMIKKAIDKYQKKCDCSFAKFTNIHNTCIFTFRNNQTRNVMHIRSKFYYSIYVSLKLHRSIYENKWKNAFKIEKSQWENIYNCKISLMHEKVIAEFNYKLLNGLLNCNLSVSKWNKQISPKCELCNCDDDIKHLLFKCTIVENIWRNVSHFLKFDIKWKTLVIGFDKEINNKTIKLNNLLAFICYRIYNYKMKCRVKNEVMSESNLRESLKHCLSAQNTVLKKAKLLNDDIYHKLSLHI